jgi:hypothetical protein
LPPWELAAWDDLCGLLRKNKTKIGNSRVRADLTGSGPIAHPTGALRQLRETFLDHHRRIRALPPRRGGKRKKAKEGGDGGPRLFDMD